MLRISQLMGYPHQCAASGTPVRSERKSQKNGVSQAKTDSPKSTKNKKRKKRGQKNGVTKKRGQVLKNGVTGLKKRGQVLT